MRQNSDQLLAQKIGYTLMILFVYMLGSSIPVPFSSITSQAHHLVNGSAFSTAAIASGANLQRISLFSVGLNPMMVAMIVLQLAVMMRLFYIDTLSTRQISAIQQVLMLIFSLIQSTTVTIGLHIAHGTWQTVAVVIILTAGSMFAVWLGIENSKHGIGGLITIIMFNMVSQSLPRLMKSVHELTTSSHAAFLVIALVVVCLLVGLFWIIFNRAYYAIPLINTSMLSTHRPLTLPIGLNLGALMTYMIGMSIMMMPMIIGQNYPGTIFANLKFQIVISAILTFLLYYFFAFMQFDPRGQAKMLRNGNNYILNVRPGKPTQQYLTRHLLVVSIAGALLNALQLSFGMVATPLLGKYDAFGLIPTNIVMIIMFMSSVRDQFLILLFPHRYERLMKEENIQ